jgi:hypothetical protein
MVSEHATKLPIFMAHGTADPVVEFKIGNASSHLLKGEFGFSTVESSQVGILGALCSSCADIPLKGGRAWSEICAVPRYGTHCRSKGAR